MLMNRRSLTTGFFTLALLGSASAHAIEINTATRITRSVTTDSTATAPSTAKTQKTNDTSGNTPFDVANYIREVNALTWSPDTQVNVNMTAKIQVLLDWNHVSAGTIDGGWGATSKQALINFQRMEGLPTTGKMDTATWSALTANIPANQPVFIRYTITNDDAKTPLAALPKTTADKAQADGLYFETLEEMLAERFHMSLAYIRKLNPNTTFKAGSTINVINTGKALTKPVSHIRINRKDNTLYAYDNTALIATYPVMVGSSSLAIPNGSYTITNKKANPWYRAVIADKTGKNQTYMLPPGANNPLGVLWLGFDKADYGIHGAPSPEAIAQPSSMGAIRMTNWDIEELASNVKTGVTVEVR